MRASVLAVLVPAVREVTLVVLASGRRIYFAYLNLVLAIGITVFVVMESHAFDTLT